MTSPSLSLAGKVALVTGASGSIGEAIARVFHEAGAFVILSGSQKDKLERLAQDFSQRVGIRVANLAEKKEVLELIPSCESQYGCVDILVNNAGLTHDNLLLRLKDEDFQSVLDVNLAAPFYLCRDAIRAMIKARSGRIINITSIVGITGNAGQTNYAASKAGLIGFTKSLALEVASRSITVNCIAPGFIVSKMTDDLPEAHRKALLENIPSKRFGSPEDIAHAALFLAHPSSSYITGQTLHVNGGMVMV